MKHPSAQAVFHSLLPTLRQGREREKITKWIPFGLWPLQFSLPSVTRPGAKNLDKQGALQSVVKITVGGHNNVLPIKRRQNFNRTITAVMLTFLDHTPQTSLCNRWLLKGFLHTHLSETWRELRVCVYTHIHNTHTLLARARPQKSLGKSGFHI